MQRARTLFLHIWPTRFKSFDGRPTFETLQGSSYLRCGWTITGNSGSAHVPVLFFAVESPDSMHCLSVVPHNEIIDFPAMGVDKLRLSGVFDQITEKDASFSNRPIEDAPGVRCEEKRFSAIYRMCSDQRLVNRFHCFKLFAAEISESKCTA